MYYLDHHRTRYEDNRHNSTEWWPRRLSPGWVCGWMYLSAVIPILEPKGTIDTLVRLCSSDNGVGKPYFCLALNVLFLFFFFCLPPPSHQGYTLLSSIFYQRLSFFFHDSAAQTDLLLYDHQNSQHNSIRWKWQLTRSEKVLHPLPRCATVYQQRPVSFLPSCVCSLTNVAPIVSPVPLKSVSRILHLDLDVVVLPVTL